MQRTAVRARPRNAGSSLSRSSGSAGPSQIEGVIRLHVWLKGKRRGSGSRAGRDKGRDPVDVPRRARNSATWLPIFREAPID